MLFDESFESWLEVNLQRLKGSAHGAKYGEGHFRANKDDSPQAAEATPFLTKTLADKEVTTAWLDWKRQRQTTAISSGGNHRASRLQQNQQQSVMSSASKQSGADAMTKSYERIKEMIRSSHNNNKTNVNLSSNFEHQERGPIYKPRQLQQETTVFSTGSSGQDSFRRSYARDSGISDSNASSSSSSYPSRAAVELYGHLVWDEDEPVFDAEDIHLRSPSAREQVEQILRETELSDDLSPISSALTDNSGVPEPDFCFDTQSLEEDDFDLNDQYGKSHQEYYDTGHVSGDDEAVQDHECEASFVQFSKLTPEDSKTDRSSSGTSQGQCRRSAKNEGPQISVRFTKSDLSKLEDTYIDDDELMDRDRVCVDDDPEQASSDPDRLSSSRLDAGPSYRYDGYETPERKPEGISKYAEKCVQCISLIASPAKFPT